MKVDLQPECFTDGDSRRWVEDTKTYSGIVTFPSHDTCVHETHNKRVIVDNPDDGHILLRRVDPPVKGVVLVDQLQGHNKRLVGAVRFVVENCDAYV